MKVFKKNKTINFKIVFLLFSALFVLISSLPVSSLNSNALVESYYKYSGGDGDYNSPYLISNRNDMDDLSEYVREGGDTSDKYYKLTNSIDMGNTNFIPIGTRLSNGNISYFKGNFDGNNCLIYNLKISSNASNICGRVGLFGYAKNANIKNIRLYSGSIKLSTNLMDAGGVVGYLDGGSVTNCSNTNVVVSCSNGDYGIVYVGGIVGYNNGYVNNCYNMANISNNTLGSAYTGGIAGYSSLEISNCFNKGVISSGVDDSAKSYAGGIAGYCESTIFNCFNMGNVSAVADIETKANKKVSINYSGTAKNITASADSYTLKKVIEYAYAGGIVGYSNNLVSNCYSVANISGGKIRTTLTTEFNLESRKPGPFGIGNEEVQYNDASVVLKYDEILHCSQINGNVLTSTSYCYSPYSCLENNFEYTVHEKVTDSFSRVHVDEDVAKAVDLRYNVNKTFYLTNLDLVTDMSSSKITLKVEINDDENCYIELCGYTTASWTEWFKKKSKTLSTTLVSLNINRAQNFNTKSTSNMKKQNFCDLLGNSWAIDDLVNDGYPFIKDIFWAFA